MSFAGSLLCLENQALYDLVRRMRKLRLASLESALDRAIEEEAEALMHIPPRKRATTSAVREAQRAAADYYTTEIRDYLSNPGYMLSADDVLNHRRKPTAWAIAQKITQAEGMAEVEARMKEELDE